ncbi:MAG: hypothetical protein U0X39_01480 [Bacteroidales bacterium]
MPGNLKYILILNVLIVISLTASSQAIDTVYFDKNWKTANSDKFEYIRVYRLFRGLYSVSDYYKTGEYMMSGVFRSPGFMNPTGQFVYYTRDGVISRVIIHEPEKYPSLTENITNYLTLLQPAPDSSYIEAVFNKKGMMLSVSYKNEKHKQAKTLYLFPDKSPSLIVFYSDGLLNGIYKKFSWNNVLKTGMYVNGKRDGIWYFYDSEGYLMRKLIYVNGILIGKIKRNSGSGV